MVEDESAKKTAGVSTTRLELAEVCDTLRIFFALSSSASAKRSDFAAEEHFSVAC